MAAAQATGPVDAPGSRFTQFLQKGGQPLICSSEAGPPFGGAPETERRVELR